MKRSKKDIRRKLTSSEFKDISSRAERESTPYSDISMLLDHIEILEKEQKNKYNVC